MYRNKRYLSRMASQAPRCGAAYRHHWSRCRERAVSGVRLDTGGGVRVDDCASCEADGWAGVVVGSGVRYGGRNEVLLEGLALTVRL